MELLIASFGESPGIVTEAIDILLDKGINIEKVILITTKDSDIKEGAEFIKRHTHQYNTYQGRISVDVKTVEEFEDIITDNAIERFIKITKEIFSFHKKEDTYVCISGGRKNMSTLLALLAQIYKAKILFHIIPPQEIEKKWEDLRPLQSYPDEINKFLHPDISQIKFVPLPLQPLISPWMQEKTADEFFNQSDYSAAAKIYRILREEISDPRRIEIKELLSWSYLNWDLFNFSKAKQKLEEVVKRIKQYNHFLIDKIEHLQNQCLILSTLNRNKEFTENIKDNQYFENIVLSLFSKAQRYTQSGIYDQAILCLYRILELISQNRLALKGMDTKKVKENIRNKYKEKFAKLKKEITGASSEIPEKIALLDSWILLAVMGDTLFGNKKELKKLYEKTNIRNKLWIIHGYSVGKKKEFSKLEEYVHKWLEKLIENFDKKLKIFDFLIFE